MLSHQRVPCEATSLPRTPPRHQQQRPRERPVAAVRKGGPPSPTAEAATAEPSVTDWSALARDTPDALPPEAQEEKDLINQVSSKALRLMLRGDRGALEEFKDFELLAAGKRLQETRGQQAALWVYVLFKLTEHVLPKQATRLEGEYLSAFEKLFAVLEDSGWKINREGEEWSQEDAEADAMAQGYSSGGVG